METRVILYQDDDILIYHLGGWEAFVEKKKSRHIITIKFGMNIRVGG